jgi:predicted flap endonuclease-1-like 5' DNA nuclease
VPLEVIAGIGAARAAQLRTFGIPDGASLAQADVATVARLRGLSDSGAVRLIAAATREVRDRRPQTLFDQ